MEEFIKTLPEQFKYEPDIKNSEKLGDYDAIVVGGMGGSGVVGGYMRTACPEKNIITHHTYDLPSFLKEDKSRKLFLAISHSGNTEETIDFFSKAIEAGHDTAAIASKGKLLELAAQKGVPYVDIPGDNAQPRISGGYMLRPALKMIGAEKAYKESEKLADSLPAQEYDKIAEALVKKLAGKVPIIYSSRRNLTAAYSWKRTLNETGKIPSFYNTFPELNHNEMQGFDVIDSTKSLSSQFHFIFLEDSADHERVKIRMQVTSDLYAEKGLPVEHIEMEGDTPLAKLFNSIILAEWTAVYTAKHYGADAEQVPLVEEFKKKII